jgi:hypothetical protein
LQETVFLSQISAVRFKLIVLVVYRHLLGAPLDHEKLVKYLSIRRNCSDADLKALVAAVSLILSGAARFDVPLDELQRELIQVGLPREHGVMLARPLARHGPQLQQRLKSQTLSLPRLQKLDWRVDLVAARSDSRTRPVPEAVLTLQRLDDKAVTMALTHDQLLVLLADAKIALNQMK